jgi:hypothetical protein
MNYCTCCERCCAFDVRSITCITYSWFKAFLLHCCDLDNPPATCSAQCVWTADHVPVVLDVPLCDTNSLTPHFQGVLQQVCGTLQRSSCTPSATTGGQQGHSSGCQQASSPNRHSNKQKQDACRNKCSAHVAPRTGIQGQCWHTAAEEEGCANGSVPAHAKVSSPACCVCKGLGQHIWS